MISPQGVTSIYIVPSSQAVNQEICLKECLQKHLQPFINKYYRDIKYIFWPDLATSHYAYLVTKWLKTQKIPFVQKKDNLANLPEARAIEDFWAMLKRDVYKNGWSTNIISNLERRIRYCASRLDLNDVQKLVQGTNTRLDQIRRYGVL